MARRNSQKTVGGQDITRCIQELLQDAKTTPQKARLPWQTQLLNLGLEEHGARCETLKQLIVQARRDSDQAQQAVRLAERNAERWSPQQDDEWKVLDGDKKVAKHLLHASQEQINLNQKMVRLHMVEWPRHYRRWAKEQESPPKARGWLGQQWDRWTGYAAVAQGLTTSITIFQDAQKIIEKSQQELNNADVKLKAFEAQWEQNNAEMVSRVRGAVGAARQDYQRAVHQQTQLEDQLSREQRQAAQKINTWGNAHQHVLIDRRKEQRHSSSSSSDIPYSSSSTDMMLLSMLGAQHSNSLSAFNTIVESADPQSFGGGSFHTGGGIDSGTHCSPTYDSSSYSSDSSSSTMSCD